MPEVAVTTDVSGSAPGNEVTTECGVCPHPWPAHDQIAARFCTATVAGGFSRECVCTPYSGSGHGEFAEEA
jgi:hypothetical protein